MTRNARWEHLVRSARARRREVLRAALGLAAASVGGASLAAALAPSIPKPRFAGYPFMLGVASGFPTAHGVTLWTRLAPAPLQADGAMPRENVHVTFEVAEDERFARVVAQGARRAAFENAHSVRATVTGLRPGRWHFYRFHAGDETSPVGRTRTADAPDADRGALRFAIGCCQHFEQGYFVAQRHLAEEDLELMLFLGDYVYESVWGDQPVRRFTRPDAVGLDDYRLRHAQTKADADLQRLHACVPFVAAWDDHEVDNDYAGEQSENLDPRFLARRAAAYQAYLEHMPMPEHLRLVDGHVATYGYTGYGRHAGFHLLDTRQWRTPQACPDAYKGGGSANVRAKDCAALADPARTLLGAAQADWLVADLGRRDARWTFLAQQTLMADIDGIEGPGVEYWTDPWMGYRAERRRVLDALAAPQVSNPVVLGGDLHATVVADLKRDFADAKAPPIATEFATTSLASQGWAAGSYDARVRENAHLKYANPTQRGYLRFDVDRRECRVALRGVDMKDARSGVTTVKQWVVENGFAGAKDA
jgi:alkaline phosphatase D